MRFFFYNLKKFQAISKQFIVSCFLQTGKLIFILLSRMMFLNTIKKSLRFVDLMGQFGYQGS